MPALRRSLQAAGLVLASVAGHNLTAVLRMQAAAQEHDHDLDHDTVIGAPGDQDGDPLHLVALGDSTTAGFGLTDPTLAFPYQVGVRLAEISGRPVRVTSLAMRGRRIRHVADEQVPRLKMLDPDVVVISVGSNDALGRRLPAQVEADTRALLVGVRTTVPDAEVVLGGAADLGDSPALPWPLRRLVSAACRWVTAAQRRAADEVGVPFSLLPHQPPEHFGPDAFHGGEACHAEAAQVTVDALMDARRRRDGLPAWV